MPFGRIQHDPGGRALCAGRRSSSEHCSGWPRCVKWRPGWRRSSAV